MVDLISSTNTMFEMEMKGTILIIAFTAIETKMLLKYSNSCLIYPSHFVLQNRDLSYPKLIK